MEGEERGGGVNIQATFLALRSKHTISVKTSTMGFFCLDLTTSLEAY